MLGVCVAACANAPAPPVTLDAAPGTADRPSADFDHAPTKLDVGDAQVPSDDATCDGSACVDGDVRAPTEDALDTIDAARLFDASDAADPLDGGATPQEPCEPGAVVDLSREGIRLGRSLRWFGTLEDAAAGGWLRSGAGCPPALTFQRVFRLRASAAGRLSVWTWGAATVVGRVAQCAPDAAIVACGEDVTANAAGEEILVAVGVRDLEWPGQRDPNFMVAVDEELPEAAEDERCRDVHRALAACGTGLGCVVDRWNSIGYCRPLGRDGGACDATAPIHCENGTCRADRCERSPRENESCGSGSCPPSMVCTESSRRCQRLGTVGAPCDPAAANGGCDAGLRCVDGVCDRSAPRGSSCAANACDRGAVCVPVRTEGSADDAARVCGIEGGYGAPCRRTADGPPCASGLACASDRTCRLPAARGEACARRACVDGACVGGVCEAARELGESCAGDGVRCRDGLVCASSTQRCALVRDVGEPCDDVLHVCDGSCVDGRCTRTVGAGAACGAPGIHCTAGTSCGEGFCRWPLANLGSCSSRELACPRGTRCSGGNCEVAEPESCGRAGDPPCSSGARCEFNTCVRVARCSHPWTMPCGPDAHCGDLFNPVVTCVDDGALGGRCRTTGALCDEGLRCDPRRMRCVRPTDGSGRCNDRMCPRGASCLGGWCTVDWPTDGMPCAGFQQDACQLGHACVAGTCRRARDGREGTLCVAGLCAQGLRCLSGVCRRPAPEGAACTEPGACGEGLACRGSSGGMRCVRGGGDGQPCRDDDPRCDAALGCANGTCVPAAALGATCRGRPCADGQTCIEPLLGEPRCVADGTREDTHCRRSERLCDRDLRCVNRGGLGPPDWRCSGGLPEGEFCAAGVQYRYCEPGLSCIGQAGVCRAPGSIGGTCRHTAPPCDHGAACVGLGRHCFTTVGENAPSFDRRCGDGLVSVVTPDGPRCRRPGTLGAPCRPSTADDLCDRPLRCDPTDDVCR